LYRGYFCSCPCSGRAGQVAPHVCVYTRLSDTFGQGQGLASRTNLCPRHAYPPISFVLQSPPRTAFTLTGFGFSAGGHEYNILWDESSCAPIPGSATSTMSFLFVLASSSFFTPCPPLYCPPFMFFLSIFFLHSYLFIKSALTFDLSPPLLTTYQQTTLSEMLMCFLPPQQHVAPFFHFLPHPYCAPPCHFIT